ncbi:MAG: GH92 family glycosyl hydrolase [Bacteroidaceae bacterium]|nr:GH92 family glycosyl hydrolase [Bacteroidaceae bacterium]
MADGNFHASPLHRNDYASGVRAGEARMKTRMLNILREILDPETLQKVREQLPIAIIAVFLLSTVPSSASLADLVNPLMGTQSTYELSTGNTYPAVARPWGMNFWTPQTGKNGDGWQYTYNAMQLRGFKQTHQPSPWMGDYGYFSVMPTSSADPKAAISYFSHKAEQVHPYEYGVYLANHDTHVRLTATERCALFDVTYGCTEHYLLIDAQPKNGSACAIAVDEQQGTISGYTANNSGGVPEGFRNYFLVSTGQPLQVAYADSSRVVVRLTHNDKRHTIRVASSFISPEQAALNMQRELGQRDYSAILAESQQAWEHALGRIEVEGGSDTERRTFYSCLYRSLLFPRMFYELNTEGKKIHRSMQNNSLCQGPYYTDTGFWDTFRALMPLLNLVYPERSQDIQEGLLNCYRETGYLPEWASPGHRDCMIGNNSAAVVADAWVRGIRPSDPDLMYEALLHGRSNWLKGTASGRRGQDYYNRLGYVPNDVGINESAARTLEYAYDDWCILQVAQSLGRPKKELKQLAAAAQNYRNLFDTTYGLMRGRKQDGSWPEEFSPFKWGGDFTEGNSWHYTWSVFHDIPGLIELMGGKARFEAMLDSVMQLPPVYDESYYGFVIHEIREMQVMGFGQYAHGNQPIQHMLYLYNYTDHPEKGHRWLREVMHRLYSPTPGGYCGDEDNGQTSAWYVFSAMGFYPLCPGSLEYATGAPLFERVTLHRSDRDITLTPEQLKKKFITL